MRKRPGLNWNQDEGFELLKEALNQRAGIK